MNPAERLLFALTHLFDITLSRLGARFCGMDLDRFQQMRLQLESEHLLVGIKEVKFLEPISAPECAYEHSGGSTRDLDQDHFNWLANQVSAKTTRHRERQIIETTVLAATPKAAVSTRGSAPDLSGPRDLSNDLSIAELVVDCHEHLEEKARRNRGRSSVGPGPRPFRQGPHDIGASSFSPLKKIERPEVAAPQTSITFDGPTYYSIREDLSSEWLGATCLRDKGLALGTYVPSLALVRGGRILHAVQYALDMDQGQLKEIHRACVEHEVSYEIYPA